MFSWRVYNDPTVLERRLDVIVAFEWLSEHNVIRQGDKICTGIDSWLKALEGNEDD